MWYDENKNRSVRYDCSKVYWDIWEYYLLLESDFIQTLNYVELSTENYDTFSKEYAK